MVTARTKNAKAKSKKPLAKHKPKKSTAKKSTAKKSIAKKSTAKIKQFNQLKREQGGRCKICKNKPKKFVVDHNHKTGKVRGLLCPRCNNLLGMSQDDPRLLQVAIQYLKRFK